MKSNRAWELFGQQASVESSIGDHKLKLLIANGSSDAGAKVNLGEDAVCLFAVESPPADETLGELYVRGDDLIARYQSNSGTLDRELYWRRLDLESENDSFAVEMIYSLQTDSLDLRPNPSIVSNLKLQEAKYWSAAGDPLAGELKWEQQDAAAGSQLVTGKLPNGIKIAIAVYPTDLVKMELTDDAEETILRCRLDSDFLEKGVIRRTRMFAAFAGGDAEDAQIVNWAQQFLDSETPLTA